MVSKDTKRMLIMNASSNIIFNYIGIFVNLYLWEKNKSIFDVAWFNLVMFVSWTVCFVVGARLISRYSNRILLRCIALCGAAIFTLLSVLELDNRMLWIAVIAVPVGAMWGSYAIAQNITLSMLGRGKDFESYFSLASINGQAISIVNPIVFALVIRWIGYAGSFLLMFVFVTILMAVSFFIPRVSLADAPEPLFRGLSLRRVYAASSLRWMVPSCLAAGFFLQFQGLFALIFTFSVSQDKLVIALLNVLYATSAIGAMILYRKARLSAGIWLAVGMAAVSVGFLAALLQHAPFLVLSNILTTVGMFYFATVWNTQQFSMITKYTPIEQARIFIWREMFLNVTRIILLGLVLPLTSLSGPWFITLLLAALACAGSVPYFVSRSAAALAKEADAS
ncbi:MFS transporter [Paenibacillus chartarius]|uniref:MFS transporter n=1 Tax=Paenibacillus chartarius TaxID=747481 RepID=A0ABV6DTA9_9BACL